MPPSSSRPVPQTVDCRVTECTPRGPGGVSVLRIEGPRARAAVEDLAGGVSLRRGAPILARLSTGGVVFEESLALLVSDSEVELHLHGSPVLVQWVARELGGFAKPAEHPTLEQRAAQLLGRAPSEAAARILLDQSEGALRRELLEAAAGSELDWQASLKDLVLRARQVEPVLNPKRVVLVGPVNAGKSTLFNLLFGRERVIASAEAGTTRDVISGEVPLAGARIHLVDTAGIGFEGKGRSGTLDRAARELAQAEQERADLLIWVAPVCGPGLDSELGSNLDSTACVEFRTHADQGPGGAAVADIPRVSLTEDPAGAREQFERLVCERLGIPSEPWSAGRAVPFEAEFPSLARDWAKLGDPLSRRRAVELYAGG